MVRDNGGHAVVLRWSMEHIMNISPNEVYFTASDIGWVVGHTYVSWSINLFNLIFILNIHILFMHHY